LERVGQTAQVAHQVAMDGRKEVEKNARHQAKQLTYIHAIKDESSDSVHLVTLCDAQAANQVQIDRLIASWEKGR